MIEILALSCQHKIIRKGPDISMNLACRLQIICQVRAIWEHHYKIWLRLETHTNHTIYGVKVIMMIICLPAILMLSVYWFDFWPIPIEQRRRVSEPTNQLLGIGPSFWTHVDPYSSLHPFLRAAIKIRKRASRHANSFYRWERCGCCWAFMPLGIYYGELTGNDGWDKLSRMEKSLSIDISRVSSFRFTDLPCFSLWFFDPIPLISNTSIYVPANE